MRLFVSILIVISIFLLFKFGSEYFQYHTYRVYKEIQILKERVDKLESK